MSKKVSASHESVADSRGRARLARFCGYINSQLTDPDFALADVAKQFRVSERYVRRTFETYGETASRYLKRRRLELAFQRLADPRHNHQTILAIAVDCGFSGAAYFSRSFRSRYDVVPKAVRKQYSFMIEQSDGRPKLRRMGG